MTLTLFSKKIRTADGNYIVEIYQEKFSNCFHVLVGFSTNDTLYKVENNLLYPDLKKAKSRYNYMIRKITKEATI